MKPTLQSPQQLRDFQQIDGGKLSSILLPGCCHAGGFLSQLTLNLIYITMHMSHFCTQIANQKYYIGVPKRHKILPPSNCRLALFKIEKSSLLSCLFHIFRSCLFGHESGPKGPALGPNSGPTSLLLLLLF
jgi:hypothetical protein